MGSARLRYGAPHELPHDRRGRARARCRRLRVHEALDDGALDAAREHACLGLHHDGEPPHDRDRPVNYRRVDERPRQNHPLPHAGWNSLGAGWSAPNRRLLNLRALRQPLLWLGARVAEARTPPSGARRRGLVPGFRWQRPCQTDPHHSARSDSIHRQRMERCPSDMAGLGIFGADPHPWQGARRCRSRGVRRGSRPLRRASAARGGRDADALAVAICHAFRGAISARRVSP